ncbi:MAG: hypothetical protein E3J37_05855 [Anaerolineales bacterium]|nr:MAG: hypothetical protein E3J37_05855 [Anaerolineales bacterium]
MMDEMNEQIILGLCIDILDETAAICGLSKVGKKKVEEGIINDNWEEWSEWFPLDELFGRISRQVTAKTNTI